MGCCRGDGRSSAPVVHALIRSHGFNAGDIVGTVLSCAQALSRRFKAFVIFAVDAFDMTPNRESKPPGDLWGTGSHTFKLFRTQGWQAGKQSSSGPAHQLAGRTYSHT